MVRQCLLSEKNAGLAVYDVSREQALSFVFLGIRRLVAKAGSAYGRKLLGWKSRCGAVEKPQRWMTEETALCGLTFQIALRLNCASIRVPKSTLCKLHCPKRQVLLCIFNGLLTKRLRGVVVFKQNAESTLIDIFHINRDLS